jgi:hypothetical protein
LLLEKRGRAPSARATPIRPRRRIVHRDAPFRLLTSDEVLRFGPASGLLHNRDCRTEDHHTEQK